MSTPSAERSLELSPIATVGLLLLFGASGGIGFVWGGIGGAFFGALGVTTTAAVIGAVAKIRAQDRTRHLSAPDLSGLASAQALSIMGAMTGSDGPLSFKSELLTALEAIDATLEAQPDEALEALQPLLTKHPRSPAVQLRRARALQAKRDHAGAAKAVTTAIRNAIDGGMNPMASAMFVEFESMRQDLNLGDRHMRVLSKALDQRGHVDLARWCESRVD